jgi:hypothetical protein
VGSSLITPEHLFILNLDIHCNAAKASKAMKGHLLNKEAVS